MAPPTVTDRNGNVLAKGDKVVVEMTVGEILVNAPAERQILLTRDEEGAPPISVYSSAVHVIKKDDYTGRDEAAGEGSGEASESASTTTGAKVKVTVPGAPKRRDGTLNTDGATQNADGNWEYPDGTVRRPNGSVV